MTLNLKIFRAPHPLRKSRVSERIVRLVYDGGKGERLDKYLVDCLPEFSRSRLQSMIKSGCVTIDGIIISKTGESLSPGSTVQVDVPAPIPTDLIPEDIPLDIIFENEDCMVVDKPAGMVVHPAAGHETGTLVHAALSHAPQMEGIGGEGRPGVVHRLDKDTSGVIILAKNDKTLHWLQDQFRQRKVGKTYLALVDGIPATPSGRIEAAIGRDPRLRRKMAVVSPKKGRQAVTEYELLEEFPEHTFLEVHPITGRTHQIRLHMLFINCPVAGDTLYGKRGGSILLKRLFLHASRLQIRLPGESELHTFEAPLPGELEGVLIELRENS